MSSVVRVFMAWFGFANAVSCIGLRKWYFKQERLEMCDAGRYQCTVNS